LQVPLDYGRELNKQEAYRDAISDDAGEELIAVMKKG
jgi:hypothetical protein